jgi:hypothetical protein
LEGKIQDQRTTGSDYFKTLKEPTAIYYTEVTFFSELRLGYIPKIGLCFFVMLLKW